MYPFPSIDDKASIDLSVVVPAYNEEARLPSMLRETIDFLEERRKIESTFNYEIIIVDDGSKDTTSQVALSYGKEISAENFRVLTLGNYVNKNFVS